MTLPPCRLHREADGSLSTLSPEMALGVVSEKLTPKAPAFNGAVPFEGETFLKGDIVKIHQEDSFKPVIITLNTRKEANAFWGICCDQLGCDSPFSKALKTELADWFSNIYH